MTWKEIFYSMIMRKPRCAHECVHEWKEFRHQTIFKGRLLIHTGYRCPKCGEIKQAKSRYEGEEL